MDETSAKSDRARSLWRTFIRVFGTTWLVVMVEGIAVAAISYSYFQGHAWWLGALAVVVALGEAFVAAGVLGLKRAVMKTMIEGLRLWRLGGAAVGKLFDRLVGPQVEVNESTVGGAIAEKLERLPLAEVERRLGGAVRATLRTSDGADASTAGRLRKRLEARLLALAAMFTLARFRSEDAAHGGVDVLKVRRELESTVDDAIARKLGAGLWLWTIAVLIGLPVVVAVQTWAILSLLKMK